MAAALMLMVVGGLFMSAWVTLMTTRATQVSYLEQISQRRIALENARTLGWQYTQNTAFDRNITIPSEVATELPLNLGGFSTGNGLTGLNIYSSLNYPGVLTSVFPYNDLGLRPGAAYLSTLKLERSLLDDSIDDYIGWQFMKTMPPVLNGDVFCIYRKPSNVATELDVYRTTGSGSAGHNANWTVEGRTLVRHPASFFVSSTPSPLQLPFLTKSLYIQSQPAAEPPNLPYPVYGTALDGTALLPSNLPVVPSTTGPVSSIGSEKYLGYLKVVRNDLNPDNSLWHFQEREALAGRTPTVTIDVGAVFNSATEAYWIAEQKNPTYTPPGWPSGYDEKLKVLFIKLDSQYLKNMRIYGVVDQIIFVGQSNATAFANAATMKPVIITIMPNGSRGRWVKDIRFERENNRRHVLAFQDDNGRSVEMSWVNNPLSGSQFRWRCVLVNEYQSIMFNMPSTLTQSVRWIGGVMTNWTIKRRASGGTNPSRLIFSGDNDPTVPAAANTGPAFATFLPRDAWLESYFYPVPPPP